MRINIINRPLALAYSFAARGFSKMARRAAFLTVFTCFFMLFSEKALAQCTPNCNTGLYEVVALPTAPCQAPTVTAGDLLVIPSSCLGVYTVKIFESDLVTVVPQPIAGSYLNVTLYAQVSYNGTPFCLRPIKLVDKTKPNILCKDTTVVCTQPLSPAILGFPTLSDNCSSVAFLNSKLTYVDNTIQNGSSCGDPKIKVIGRLWTTKDESDNFMLCAQKITVLKPDIFHDVEFPLDTVHLAACKDSKENLALTGQPKIQNWPILGSNCGVLVTKYDTIKTFCGTTDTIWKRCWVVSMLNDCTNLMDTIIGIQCIAKEDLVKPVLNCPADFTVGTDPGLCTATVVLPQLFAQDFCAGSIEAEPTWAYGIGDGPFQDVVRDTFTVTYAASDCNTTATCTVKVTIADLEPPIFTAAPKTIAISGNPTIVQASTFITSASDNCSGMGDLTFKIDIGSGYVSSLALTCAQAGSIVANIIAIDEAGNESAPTQIVFLLKDNLKPMFINTSGVQNKTLSCTDPALYNLAGCGQPTAIDNCGTPTVVYTEEKEVNACGTGQITRKWVATDPCGNSATFIQIITVKNDHPFAATNIQWPQNQTILGCSGSLDPTPTNSPVIVGQFCGMPAISHKDDVYDNGGNSCKKIVRRWKIIDWCNYDSATDSPSYIFYQTLTVMDVEKPVLKVPDNLTVSLGSTCQTGAVTGGVQAYATDCSAILNWKQFVYNPTTGIFSNNIYALNPNSKIVDGNYPPGETTVKISVTDGCGNESVGVWKVVVKDLKPPTPICMEGLSVNLTMMTGGQAMAMLDAVAFNQSSYDNCTAKANLKYTIRRHETPLNLTPPTATNITFTCADVGTVIIDLWAMDESGNADFCTTYVIVQDNKGFCIPPPPAPQAKIEGKISTPMGETVENATVELMNSNAALPVNTSQNGVFLMENLPIGQSFNVHPMKNDDPLNGLSTLDLVRLQKHILGTLPFTSPYQFIAGDINKNGAVTTFDVLELRKVILGVYPNFPQNTSWRFVDSSFVFPDPLNPLNTVFPEMKSVSLTNGMTAQTPFIAIKIGDLNNSATANTQLAGESNDRSDDDELRLISTEKSWETGDLVEIPIKTADFKRIAGMQFTLEFDPSALSLEDFQAEKLTHFSTQNLGTTHLDEGLLSLSWDAPDGLDLNDDDLLFTLKMRAATAGNLSENLRLSSRLTRSEAYEIGDKRRKPTLSFERADGSVETPKLEFAVFQNRPNPFREQTSIGFQLPENEPVTLKIYDLAGRLVFEKTTDGVRGYQEFLLEKTDLPNTGLYLYRVETSSRSETRRLLIE